MTDAMPTAPVVSGVTEGANGSAQATQQAGAPAEQKYELKINGQTRQMSLEELKKHASISQASNEKFEQAKKMHTEAQQLKEAFSTGDVVGSLTRMGKSPKEIKTMLEDNLLSIIEQEQMDPRERELRELKEYKVQQERARQELEQQELTAKQQREVMVAQARLEEELVSCMQASNLPQTALMFQRIAREMETALMNGYELSAKDATRIVEQDVIDEYLAMLPKLGADRLKKALGKDGLKLLQEEQVKAVKEAQPEFAKPRKTAAKSEKATEDSLETMGSFFRKLHRGA
jgi:uncharacterized protein YbcI